MYKLSSKLSRSMYKYVLTYILRVGVCIRDISMRVLAEQNERGEHESKVIQYVEIFR